MNTMSTVASEKLPTVVDSRSSKKDTGPSQSTKQVDPLRFFRCMCDTKSSFELSLKINHIEQHTVPQYIKLNPK